MALFRSEKILTLAGKEIPLDGLVHLFSIVTIAGRFSPFYTAPYVGSYQVPAGFNLRVLGFRFFNKSGVSQGNFNLLYCDDDILTFDAVAPTLNPVYHSPAALNMPHSPAAVSTQPSYFDIAINFVIPSGKYPDFYSLGLGSCMIFCQLEAV